MAKVSDEIVLEALQLYLDTSMTQYKHVARGILKLDITWCVCVCAYIYID